MIVLPPSYLTVLRGEMGVHEISGAPANPRIVAYHRSTTLSERFAISDETAWCSSCINWVMEEAGYVGTDSARAKSWLDWGLELAVPFTGAVTVIQSRVTNRYHVALFIDWMPDADDPSGIRLLGGNQSNAVQYSTYALDRWHVRGYRAPIVRAA